MAAEAVRTGRTQLGEGPAWDAEAGVLWFVDIKGRRVHSFDPSTREVRSWAAPC